VQLLQAMIPKQQKKNLRLDCIFVPLGSSYKKAGCKMLVKSTLESNPLNET
jgi:hypothetical protein